MTQGRTRTISIVIQAIDRSQSVLNRMERNFSNFQRGLQTVFQYGSAAALGFLAVVVKTGFEFNSMVERAEASFGRLAGSGPLGKKFLDDLMSWTRGTALPFDQAIKSAQEFLARGFQIKEVIPVLQAVGDAAATFTRPIEQSMQIISFNLGQIHSSAILQQRDLRDLANAGVNAWKYLAEAEKMSVGELKYNLDKHKIAIKGTFAFDAIVAGMKRDFSGMLALQSQTASGQIAIAKRTFGEMAGIFTKPLFDTISVELRRFNQLLADPKFRASVKEWGQAFDKFVSDVARGFGQTIIPAFSWIIDNETRLKAAIIAIAIAFARFNPVLTVLAAIVLALQQIGELKDAQNREKPPTETTFGGPGRGGIFGSMNDFLRTKIGGPFANLPHATYPSEMPGYQSNREYGPPNPAEFLRGLNGRALGPAGPEPIDNPPVADDFVPPDTGTESKYKAYLKAIQDAMEDGLVTFKEYLDINQRAAADGFPQLTAAEFGLMEAQAALTKGDLEAQEATFRLEKEVAALKYASEKSAEAVAKVSEAFVRNALDLQRTAVRDLLSTPTREGADFGLSSAHLNEYMALQKLAAQPLIEAAKAEQDRLKTEIKAIDDMVTSRAQLVSDSLEAMSRALEDNVFALNMQKDSLQRQLSDVLPGQEATRRSLQAQLDALDLSEKNMKRKNDLEVRAANDAQTAWERQMKGTGKGLQGRLDAIDTDPLAALTRLRDTLDLEDGIRQAHGRVLEAQALAADATLVHEWERDGKLQTMIANIVSLSGQLQTITDINHEYVIPSVQAAQRETDLWTAALMRSRLAIGGVNTAVPVGAGGAIASSYNVNGNVFVSYGDGSGGGAGSSANALAPGVGGNGFGGR